MMVMKHNTAKQHRMQRHNNSTQTVKMRAKLRNAFVQKLQNFCVRGCRNFDAFDANECHETHDGMGDY
jgi:hypothetical protein